MILPKRTQERETSLLMHYLDDVFPLQFPFHETTSVGKREWLLMILTSTRPVYYATLSLSLLHKEACLDDHETELASIWQEEKMRYFILALRESQQMLHELSSVYSQDKVKGHIHALASAIQLISFESSSLGKGDWQIHLRAGASLILVLIEGWEMVTKSGKPASSVWNRLDAENFNATHDGESLSFEYVGALSFLTNVLAVFGILSCISIGPSSPFTAYQYLMDDHAGLIQIDQIVGCRNWVISAILDVGMLDKWKREEQDNHRLSLKELSRRAMSIEGVLENGIQEAAGGALVDIVTSIYTTLTLTYLHSVVSGLNPHLSEIQESVSRTIALLKQLPESRMVTALVWPMCITGCMASRDQEDFFTGLIGSAAVTNRALGNCWAALQIMEDAWKMRDHMSKQSSTRWEEVINGRGPPTLLI